MLRRLQKLMMNPRHDVELNISWPVYKRGRRRQDECSSIIQPRQSSNPLFSSIPFNDIYT